MIKLGEVETLVTDDLLNLCKAADKVAVSGFARSGKSKVAQILAQKLDRGYINTDEYLDIPWKDVPEAVIKDLDTQILCGVHVPRILRKGLDGSYKPDLVIHCNINEESLYELYKDSDTPFTKIVAFNKGISKVFTQWASQRECQIIVLNTSFVKNSPSMEILNA